MRVLLLTIFGLLAALPAAAERVALQGAIGPYEIEVELERAQDAVQGRYRYAGREAWLELSGESYGQDALYLQEFAEGETQRSPTGDFYLELSGNGFSGYWVGAGNDYPVDLRVVSGDAGAVFAEVPTPQLNRAITGRYSVGGYWVNDWFAPNYEIGFNGGAVDAVQVSADAIYVSFDFVVGPTYHIASFRGLAGRTSDGVFVHDAPLAGGDENCRLVFAFQDGALRITDQDNGFACQFGMRAHANFTLQKISNIAEFGEEW